jgi:hypothetical protein
MSVMIIAAADDLIPRMEETQWVDTRNLTVRETEIPQISMNYGTIGCMSFGTAPAMSLIPVGAI